MRSPDGPVLILLVWVFTALLLLLLGASIAGARGVLRRNHLFGIRLPGLLRSDQGWRRGHRAAVLPAGIALAVAVTCDIAGIVTTAAYWGTLLAFVAGVVAVFVRAARAADAEPSRLRTPASP